MKILLVTAMETETLDIVEKFKMRLEAKLADFYPLYSAMIGDREVSLLQTYVGSINAPAAASLVIDRLKPDYVIKIGCIGGNAPGLKANDIIVPTRFFHSGAWLTRSYIDNYPTNDASLWQSLYGDLPYQNNKANIGGLDFSFEPSKKLNQVYKDVLNTENINYIEAPLGSGDMVIFSKEVMNNIRENILKLKDPLSPWCTDNESHSVAQICSIYKTPFTGIYFIASSDCEELEGYNPESIRSQTKNIILPLLEKVLLKI